MSAMTQEVEIEASSARKRRAAIASTAASLVLTLAKLGAGALSGSLALISEGAHNAVDIGVSALTFFAIREADRPADEEHPFGHAKIEAVAALAQTGFLCALAFGVAYQALLRLGAAGPEVDANGFAFAAIVLSLVVDLARWRGLRRVARETGSDALAADALHFSSDLVSSLLVLIGLLATRAGVPHADALAAIGVALFIGVAGYRLGRRTIDALVDAAPKGLAAQVRRATVTAPGIAGLDFLRLRRNGARIVGDLGVFVSRTLPLERVAAIKSELSDALQKRWPAMRLTITANPFALDDESVLERVQLIASRRRLFVHHVTIQHVGGRACVSLDLEVDGRMSLGDAHEVASKLEQAIAGELGEDIEVETHIEPMETRELSGEDADPALTQRFVDALNRLAPRASDLIDIHDVRLRAAEGGFFGIFHCRVDPRTSVEAAHAQVDSLERAVRREFPEVLRVVGHAEPTR
jgi:cation diffusion facilitator family transporter